MHRGVWRVYGECFTRSRAKHLKLVARAASPSPLASSILLHTVLL